MPVGRPSHRIDPTSLARRPGPAALDARLLDVRPRGRAHTIPRCRSSAAWLAAWPHTPDSGLVRMLDRVPPHSRARWLVGTAGLVLGAGLLKFTESGGCHADRG